MENAFKRVDKVAVIVRKKVQVAGRDVEMKTFQPAGAISKAERLQAERLDAYLSENMRRVVKEILKATTQDENNVRRWYLLGLWLRELTGDYNLVSTVDVDSGVLWDAVWEHLPEDFKPKRAKLEQPYSEKRQKRKDHLSISFEIGAFEWSDVSWIRRWDYWQSINFRPSILHDIRILRWLGREIKSLPEYPNQEKFREILKNIARKFPARHGLDTTARSDNEIEALVREAVRGY